MQRSKQYFESIVFQNNHMQLEIKKLSELFNLFISNGGCNSLSNNIGK